MKASQRIILAGMAAGILTTASPVSAIEGLKLQIRCPDVVLSWPSTNGETYLAQYRATLDTNSDWQTLTNYMPPATGTNLTAFVHSNRVDCPAGQVFGMMLASGGANAMMTTAASSLSVEERTALKQAREEARLNALYVKCKLEGREPYDWELKNQPPLPLSPEEVRARILKARADKTATLSGATLAGATLAGPSGAGGANGPQPAGDGLTPSTGFYRVVRNGVHLVGITNGVTLSGSVTIPVEAGNDSGTLTSLSLNEGGVPVSDQSISEAPFSLPLALTMDTTRMSNGVHQIFANASWYIPGTDDPYYQASSPVVTINVYNEISFPNWMPLFGQLYDSLYITAQSAHADADWYIDVYGGDSGYIGTFGGHTYDGNIEVVWNLIGPPPNYPSYANEPYFDFVVETFFIGAQGPGNGPQPMGSTGAATPRTSKNWDYWTVRGDWVVANQLFWGGWVGGNKLNEMADKFVDMAESAFGLTVRPNHDYLEAFRIPYDTGGTTEIDKWRDFRQALYDPHTRNLFYSGHGSNKGIGYNASNTNVFIPRAEIASVLRTVPAGQTNRHAFRFVFLDGCESASGHLPEAFGIIREKDLPYTHYLNAGERYSSFVGWNIKPTIGYTGHLVNTDHWKFIINFQYLWFTSSLGLRECLNKATGKAGVICPEGPNNVNPNDLTVYGYKDLGPNQHNGL